MEEPNITFALAVVLADIGVFIALVSAFAALIGAIATLLDTYLKIRSRGK